MNDALEIAADADAACQPAVVAIADGAERQLQLLQLAAVDADDAVAVVVSGADASDVPAHCLDSLAVVVLNDVIANFDAIVGPWTMVAETVSFVDVANAVAPVVAIVVFDAAGSVIADYLGIAIAAAKMTVTVVLSVPVNAICLTPAAALSIVVPAIAAVTAVVVCVAAIGANVVVAAGIVLTIEILVWPVAADDDAVADGGKVSY